MTSGQAPGPRRRVAVVETRDEARAVELERLQAETWGGSQDR